MASVHYDMMDQTPLRNAKLEGYPSLMLVGTDEKPATFTGQEPAAANAMPTQPSTSEELEAMLATPLSGSVRNATTVATSVMNNANNAATLGNQVNADVAMNANVALNANANAIALESPALNNASRVATANTLNTRLPPNTYIPSNEMPPDAVTDIVTARTGPITPTPTMKGGSLLESLYAVAKEGAHAALLVGASASLSRRFRKSRTRRTKHSKKTKTRRSH